VLPPVLRFAVVVLSDTSEFSDVDVSNTVLDTSLDDVFREAVEEVGAALRPLRVKTSGFLAA
jgi:hypothetical protein